jgi:hypothetical protein
VFFIGIIFQICHNNRVIVANAPEFYLVDFFKKEGKFFS